MRLRIAIQGIPNFANPQSWPFPTAGLISYDPIGGTAIFDIPDADAPASVPAIGSPGRPNTPVGDVVIDGSGVNNAQWLATLKQRYPQIQINQAPQIK